MLQENTQNQLPEAVLAQLSASDSDDRMWVIYELEQYEPELIGPELIKAVQDEHRAVREAASEMLGTMPPKLVTPNLVPLLGSERIEVRNIVSAILTKFSDDAVDDLISALTHGNEDVRKFAADILGLNGSKLAVPGLCNAALNDSVENVVVSAIEALGKIGSPEALETLYKVVEINDAMQNEAIEAIGLIGGETSTSFLENQLDKGPPLRQFAIIDALGNIGSESSIVKLKEYFNSDIPDFLIEPIIVAMLKIVERKRVNLFEKEPESLVKTIAGIIIAGNDVVADIVAMQLTLGQSEEVLTLFLKYANKFPSSLLVTLTKAATEYISLINEVAGLARHEDEWVAYSAIEAMEKYGAENVGDLLISLLKELDGMPVVAAIRAAISLKIEGAVPIIEVLTESNNDDIRETALGAMANIKAGNIG